ncbi:MAG: hypothetical protein Q4C95_03380 [Planctomycetia bacterium]|nr:hypothetical protein [Planctomycetia bacterium]
MSWEKQPFIIKILFVVINVIFIFFPLLLQLFIFLCNLFDSFSSYRGIYYAFKDSWLFIEIVTFIVYFYAFSSLFMLKSLMKRLSILNIVPFFLGFLYYCILFSCLTFTPDTHDGKWVFTFPITSVLIITTSSILLLCLDLICRFVWRNEKKMSK